MGTEPDSRVDLDGVTCPFFGAAMTPDGTNRCLAGRYPLAITPKYAATYCATDQHVECSLFVAAQDANKGGEVIYHGEAPSTLTQPEIAASQATDGAVTDQPPDTIVGEDSLTEPFVVERNRPKWPWPIVSGLTLLVLALIALVGLRYLRDPAQSSILPSTVSETATGEPTANVILTHEPTASVRVAGVDGTATVGTVSALKTMTPAGEVVAPTETPVPAPTNVPRLSAVPTPTATQEPTSTPPSTAIPQPTSTPIPAPTATPTPTNTATPEPTSTPTPSPTSTPVPQFRARGIGLSKASWEKIHGKAQSTIGGFGYYENGEYVVSFLGGKVQHLERTWVAQDAVFLDTARAAGKELLPADAKLVRTFAPRTNRLLEIYRSKSVRRQFPLGPTGPWAGGGPGTITVLYRIYGGVVRSMVLDVGTIS